MRPYKLELVFFSENLFFFLISGESENVSRFILHLLLPGIQENYQLRINFHDDFSLWGSQFIWKFKPKGDTALLFWTLIENIQFKFQQWRCELFAHFPMLNGTYCPPADGNLCTERVDLSYTWTCHCAVSHAPEPLGCSSVNCIFFLAHTFTEGAILWGCQPRRRGFRLGSLFYFGPINVLPYSYKVPH